MRGGRDEGLADVRIADREKAHRVDCAREKSTRLPEANSSIIQNDPLLLKLHHQDSSAIFPPDRFKHKLVPLDHQGGIKTSPSPVFNQRPDLTSMRPGKILGCECTSWQNRLEPNLAHARGGVAGFNSFM
jgi:hypothetical protein